MALDLEGIVLKTINYGDHHKILRVLSDRYGIIGIFVTNASKPRSRFGALAQPMILAGFSLKENSNPENGLHFLYAGEVENYFHRLKMDYENIAYFYHMTELLVKGGIEPQSGPYVFLLLKKTLLLGEEGVPMQTLALAFMLKFLSFLGIKPSLDCCGTCGATEKIAAASISQGGLVCVQCHRTGEKIILGTEEIPYLRALEQAEPDRLRSADIPPKILDKLELFIEGWYESYSGLHLKSAKILKDFR